MSVDFSLVVPCYQEEEHLAVSVPEVLKTLDDTRWSYELIFVDDCSTDATRSIIEKLCAEHSEHCLRVLLHESNQGRGQTVMDGIRAATGSIVGFIDIDLEVPCRYIPSMLRCIEEGADLVMADRIYKLEPSLLIRGTMSRGYNALVRRLVGIGFRDTEAGYKFFRRDRILPILDQIKDKGWFWDTEIVARSVEAGLRVELIPTLFLRRRDKTSTVHLVWDSFDYLKALLRYWRSKKKRSPWRQR